MKNINPRISNLSKAATLLTNPTLEGISLLKGKQGNSKINGLGQKYAERGNGFSFYSPRCLALLAVFLFGSLCVNAQTTRSTQPTTSNPSPGAAQAENAREVEGAFKDMSSLGIPRTEESSKRRQITELTRNTYRKPTKAEMKALEPSADYFNKYAGFLRQSDTGLIKLNSDSSCAGNADVVTAKENCLQYSMPGAGTAYSFRAESHRIPRLADLTLSKNVLKSDGVFQHGIMVKLGDIPIEDVTLQTQGLKYLIDFQPLTDAESLAKFDSLLLKGINVDGFVYGVGFYIRNHTTYALRSVAYKGKAMRSVNGIAYNELDFDRRRDILVVFRIVGIEKNGNLTIVWKILSNKDAPTLKTEQNQDSK
ncbi:MAG TPA: hypothetical protein VK892_02340 [Pyrinomonadaceae bacterium]|nr:hypothetical protein [Pyrinomonadaceae bacterium]